MKAAELNGTHLGQTISVQLDGAHLRDVLVEVTHEADQIAETPICTKENYTHLGRRHTHLRFQRLGSLHVAPDAVIVLAASEPPKRGAHHLTENPNADPICHCGWDPARLYVGIRSREDARNAIREHIADTKEPRHGE